MAEPAFDPRQVDRGLITACAAVAELGCDPPVRIMVPILQVMCKGPLPWQGRNGSVEPRIRR
jgi:hypothetical protein